MEKTINEIENIQIPPEHYPSNNDYIRGYCLYRIKGYNNPRYVIHDEPIESFKKESKIYKYSIGILRSYNLNLNEWTLFIIHNDEWFKTFRIVKKKID